MDLIYIFAIEIEGKHIGNTTLRITEKHSSGYAEIYIGEARYRHKGYGTQAMKLFIDKCFNEIGLHRIWLLSILERQDAFNLYHKLGFKIVGVRNDSLYRKGEFYSEIEWEMIRPKMTMDDIKDLWKYHSELWSNVAS